MIQSFPFIRLVAVALSVYGHTAHCTERKKPSKYKLDKPSSTLCNFKHISYFMLFGLSFKLYKCHESYLHVLMQLWVYSFFTHIDLFCFGIRNKSLINFPRKLQFIWVIKNMVQNRQQHCWILYIVIAIVTTHLQELVSGKNSLYIRAICLYI